MKKTVTAPFADITLEGNFLRWKIVGNAPIPATQRFFVEVLDWDKTTVFSSHYDCTVREVDFDGETPDWKTEVLEKPKDNYKLEVDLQDVASGASIAQARLEVKLGVPWYKRTGAVPIIVSTVIALLCLTGMIYLKTHQPKSDESLKRELEENRIILSAAQKAVNELKARTNAVTVITNTVTETVVVTNDVVRLVPTNSATTTTTGNAVIPANLPTPPPSGVAVGIGTLNGDLNLNVGGDGRLTIGIDGQRQSRKLRHLNGMPAKPAYETNILPKATSPRKGVEISVYMEVPPGDGVRFIKPEGWRVVSEVYASADDYARDEQYQRVVNVNNHDDPDWITLELAPKRQTPIKVESFWIRSTTGRTLIARFILTYDHDPQPSTP